MGRFIDYYAILNLPATASAEEIEKALGAEGGRLRDNVGLSPADRDERLRFLSRARTVLCDEQNRMMYDIMGKDVSADESWVSPENQAVMPASAASPISPAASSSPETPTIPAEAPMVPANAPVPDHPKTQRELDAEMEFKRLSMELQLRAERLQEGKGDDKNKPFFRTRFGRIVIWILGFTVVSSIMSLIVSRMMLP